MVIEVSIVCVTTVVMGALRFADRVERRRFLAEERNDPANVIRRAFEEKRRLLERQRAAWFATAMNPATTKENGLQATQNACAIDAELVSLADEELLALQKRHVVDFGSPPVACVTRGHPNEGQETARLAALWAPIPPLEEK